MVQYMQISKYNAAHTQNEREKSHDHINRCGKAFDMVQHPFMIKTLSKVGKEGEFLNIIKATYERPRANIMLNGQKLKCIPLRSVVRVGCPLSPLLFNIVLEVPAKGISQEKEKEVKGIQIEKRKEKCHCLQVT